MLSLISKYAFLGEIIKMLGLLKNHTYSIGVEAGIDKLKLVQLANNGKGISLIAGSVKDRPEDMQAGSSDWQKWAIENIRLLTAYGSFRGKQVIATVPTSEVFIDHIKMPKTEDSKLQEAVFSKIKQKLPFEPLQENTMMKYIPTEEENFLVMATERKIIERHLAIYEEAGLSIKSIGVWPTALANCYVRIFFEHRFRFLSGIGVQELNSLILISESF